MHTDVFTFGSKLLIIIVVVLLHLLFVYFAINFFSKIWTKERFLEGWSRHYLFKIERLISLMRVEKFKSANLAAAAAATRVSVLVDSITLSHVDTNQHAHSKRFDWWLSWIWSCLLLLSTLIQKSIRAVAEVLGGRVLCWRRGRRGGGRREEGGV